ncbi:hypothetical protein [Thalassobaculum sp.]|uniref:hypothetical protein n=1 Tax=Thalassobaculum sp. TaxID=2022740 RepID=UPI0032EE3956
MARLDPIEEDDGGAEGGGAEMFSPEPLFVPRDPPGPRRADRAGSDRSSRPGQVPETGAKSDGAQVAPQQTRSARDSVPGTSSPQQAANPLPASLAHAIQSLERTFIDTNQQILDALKAPRAAQSRHPGRHPGRRSWRRSLAVASVATLLGAAVAGGATFATVGGHEARAGATDPRLQSWADSWAYLWRTATGFQACWTKHAQTRQPQTCTITLGTAPAGSPGS